MTLPRDVPVPDRPHWIRAEVSLEDFVALQRLGADRGGLSVAAVARLALSLIARSGAADFKGLAEEYERVRTNPPS